MSVQLEPTVDTAVLRDRVREMYRDVAEHPGGEFHFETGRALAEGLSYPAEWLGEVPSEALASFAGVGHMLDLARIAPGETVLDLGSGSGTDAFVAAHLTGPAGRVIGVDMTDAQLAKARRLRDSRGLQHVAFVEGLIEEPPAEPGSVDVVISNGVVNLAPDKQREPRRNVALWAACIAGAVPRDDYLATIEAAGLRVEIVRPNAA